MTFEQFQSTGRDVEDLGRYDMLLVGVRGRVYLDGLSIEDAQGWPDYDPAHSDRWYLRIANCEWLSDSLEDLERRLYQFAVSEQIALPEEGGTP